MKIIDPKAIERCRQSAAGVCEHCRRNGIDIGHVHHVFARGLGGAQRLDVGVNLLFLCPTCHLMAHDGNISREALLDIVARREKRTAQEIMDEINLLRMRK